MAKGHARSYIVTATRSISAQEKPVVMLTHNFLGEELEQGKGGDGERHPVNGSIERNLDDFARQQRRKQRNDLPRDLWNERYKQDEAQRAQIRGFARHMNPFILQDG